MNSIAALTWANVTKDLRLEWRSRDVLNSMLFFALLVVVIFSFSFDLSVEEGRRWSGVLIWTAFLFCTVMALTQSAARELRNGVRSAFRVCAAAPDSCILRVEL